MEEKACFSLPTRVNVSRGAFTEVTREAMALGRTVLVVTGRSAMHRTGVLARLREAVEEAGGRFVLFDRVFPNPTTDLIDEGADLARREKAEVVVGLGGGSAMDTAKAVAMAAKSSRPAAELFFAPLSPETPALPIIAVPTTSGTGSEVTPIAVMTDPRRRRKIGVSHHRFYPTVALVDPELTTTMPPAVTASSGMDALAHAVESYLSKNATAISALFAEEAVRLVFQHLETASQNGNDLGARTGMAIAAVMGGVTLAQAGTILGHAVGMGIGGVMEVDHGAIVGLLLPEVLTFVLPHSLSRLARLAHRTDLVPPATEERRAAEEFIAAVRRLVTNLPLPPNLAAMGCDPARLPEMVRNTMEQRALQNLPVVPGPAEVEDFLRRVLNAKGV
ncbi:MAG: iron-containing alcohol dehydrogenase [Firmicutes bacterium]|nr:iron-containing alcohol dehydrogenase [Bacillota bacterium]